MLCDMRPSAARALLPAGPCGLFRRVPSASPRRANFFSKPQMLFSFLVEKSHGRIETRSCTAMPVGNLPAKEGWEGLQSIARIQRERIEGTHVSNETIYYISSLQPNAALIAETVKEHWGVENGLHWRLDVVFRQDESRYRDRIGASNQAVIYKMALNALLQEDSLKKGVATKQCAAACNPMYRTKMLNKILGFP